MADAQNPLSETDFESPEQLVEIPDATPIRQRLLVVSPPANRTMQKDGRSVTSLASVFGRFAEMQHMVGDQVVALEDSVEQQGQHLADVAAQLPDMRERINWLIASYYEDDRESQGFRDRLSRQEACLTTLTEAVRGLCEAQAQWKHTVDQLLRLLGGSQAPDVTPPPRFPE